MIDSFINYESNQAGLGSPSFFSKNFDDMFRFNFADADPETYNLLPSQQSPPETNQESLPKEVAFDVFSSHSAYSTNPSLKHSPEYAPEYPYSPDNQGEDDNQYTKPTKSSGVMKKGIRKQYEPIIDNNIVYRYEEDPCEYRKARKRIQNRESATRVRNRKKTHVEELEEEMDVIRKEKAELKVHNASLIAENNMLKQQITFLERIVARGSNEEMIENGDFPEPLRTETSDSMLHFMNKTEPSDSILQFINKSGEDIEDAPQPGCKYFRAAPPHQFKKQVALLGVFTLLLCVYGLLPRTEPVIGQFFTKSTFGKANSIAFAVQPGSDASGFAADSQKNLNQNPWKGSIFAWSVEIVVIISYVVFLIYVGVAACKRHSLKRRNAVLTPI